MSGLLCRSCCVVVYICFVVGMSVSINEPVLSSVVDAYSVDVAVVVCFVFIVC